MSVKPLPASLNDENVRLLPLGTSTVAALAQRMHALQLRVGAAVGVGEGTEERLGQRGQRGVDPTERHGAVA